MDRGPPFPGFDDVDHEAAQQTHERLLDEGAIFVTTSFVLGEAITPIRYHLHHAAAVRFWNVLRKLIASGLVEWVRVDEGHEEVDWEILGRYQDQTFSCTDCTSFAVIRDLSLSGAFAADRHFATAGFVLVG